MTCRRLSAAFTLIELLTVIAIIAILVAISAPLLSNFRKGDTLLSANQQMLGAVARARQLAISQHTTVYMVFLPVDFWGPDADKFVQKLNPAEKVAATNLLDKQLTGYTFISLRRVDDQPGQNTPQYLSPWESLPSGSFIPRWKFTNNVTMNVVDPGTGRAFPVRPFDYAKDPGFPFPSVDVAFNFRESPSYPGVYVQLPYIAFNYLGQPTTMELSPQPSLRDEYIPLAHGGVLPAINRDGNPTFGMPSAAESPPGNSTNSYNLIHIDAFTGHARVEQPEVQ